MIVRDNWIVFLLWIEGAILRWFHISTLVPLYRSGILLEDFVIIRRLDYNSLTASPTHLNATIITGSEGVEHGHRIGIARSYGEHCEGAEKEDVVSAQSVQTLVDAIP